MKQKRKQSPKESSNTGTNTTSGGYTITNGSITTTGVTTLPHISSGSNVVYSTWSTDISIGGGKLTEENGDLIWVRPNGNKVNLTGKEAAFNKLYETLKAPSKDQ